MDEVVRLIASVLDYPSVYMGGPSHHNIRQAEKILKALEGKGYKLVKDQQTTV